MRFIPEKINGLKLPAGKMDHFEWDDRLPGFGVRIRAGGKKTFVCQYKLRGQTRRDTISVIAGLVDKQKLAEARREAEYRIEQASKRIDPRIALAAADLQAARTFDSVSKNYLDEAKARLRPRSFLEIQRHIEKHWKPFEKIPLSAIQRADVAAQLRVIAQPKGDFGGPLAANRARATLSAFFSWAISEGLADANPVIGSPRPGTETKRDRVLEDFELVEIWRACRDDDYGRIVKLLLLTAQRRDEVGRARADELNDEKQLWALPGGRTKNGLAHDVHLTCLASELFRDAAKAVSSGDALFGTGENGFSGWSKAKAALDKRINEARARAGILKPMPAWVLHDLRRSSATGMARLGVAPHVIDAVLNHISGYRAGVTGVYLRDNYSRERRVAMDLWGAHVETLLSGKSASNVLPMQQSA